MQSPRLLAHTAIALTVVTPLLAAWISELLIDYYLAYYTSENFDTELPALTQLVLTSGKLHYIVGLIFSGINLLVMTLACRRGKSARFLPILTASSFFLLLAYILLVWVACSLPIIEQSPMSRTH